MLNLIFERVERSLPNMTKELDRYNNKLVVVIKFFYHNYAVFLNKRNKKQLKKNFSFCFFITLLVNFSTRTLYNVGFRF